MNPPAPFRVIIVEDLTLLRQDLEYLLAQQPGFTLVGSCGTVHEALILIQTTKPDLLLLDIGLPDGTGFDILEHMYPAHPKVIFLTGHSEHAIRAIRYGAIDYLLKPLDADEFSEALQKVTHAQPLLEEQITIALQSFRKNKQEDNIAFRSHLCVQIVKVKDICYLQADNGCTTVFLNGGNKVVTTKSLRDYEELLPGASFLRIHHSYLINGSYIARYLPKEGLVNLKDGTQIPVSVRKKEILDHYFKTL